MKVPEPKMMKYHIGRVNYSAETIEELAQFLEGVGTPVIIRLNCKLYRVEEETLNPDQLKEEG